MLLSIIIPVYNEVNTLEKILDKVEKAELPVKKEIILVDDGSTDGSRELLKKLAKRKGYKVILRDKNGGKGLALRTGFKHASGDLITIQDADLEYEPEDIALLLHPILRGWTNVVYGSRFLGQKLLSQQRWAMPTHYLGNKLLSILTSLLYFRWITDMETCYKVFTREALDSIKLNSKHFDFEPEITAKFIKKGYRIMELPIRYTSRSVKEGKKISWKDGIPAVLTLIKYRFI